MSRLHFFAKTLRKNMRKCCHQLSSCAFWKGLGKFVRNIKNTVQIIQGCGSFWGNEWGLNSEKSCEEKQVATAKLVWCYISLVKGRIRTKSSQKTAHCRQDNRINVSTCKHYRSTALYEFTGLSQAACNQWISMKRCRKLGQKNE